MDSPRAPLSCGAYPASKSRSCNSPLSRIALLVYRVVEKRAVELKGEKDADSPASRSCGRIEPGLTRDPPTTGLSDPKAFPAVYMILSGIPYTETFQSVKEGLSAAIPPASGPAARVDARGESARARVRSAAFSRVWTAERHAFRS